MKEKSIDNFDIWEDEEKFVNTNNNIVFTTDQDSAIKNLIEFINADWNDKHISQGLCGAGGVGKTFITNHIITNCKYSNSTIICTAPTHKACRVLSNALRGKTVDTIQSVFGFRPNVDVQNFDPSNPLFMPMGKPKIAGCKLLIIDEASMLPSKLVDYIYNICKKNQIKIIFQGDDKQLPPVKESLSSAFRICNKINYLYQIVRQEENNPIRDIVSLIREDIDNKTFNIFKFFENNKNVYNFNEFNEGYAICSLDDFKKQIHSAFSDESYLKDINLYKIVAYTNQAVGAWNKFIRDNIICKDSKGIITKDDLLMSYDNIVNEFTETILFNSEEYIITEIHDHIDATYNFKGYLVKLQKVSDGTISKKPLFIIDHEDSYTAQMYIKTLNSLTEDGKKNGGSGWRKFYKFKSDYLLATNIYDKYGKLVYGRQLDYGFAITSHKSQGSTYNTVFVDVRNMIYDKNNVPYANKNDLMRRLYVACSRAKCKLILYY